MTDTGALKTFATRSRTELMEQMRLRIRRLLADPAAQAERPREIALLRAAIEESGEAAVAETAAYTWFNRLTAARFMDVRGFSGAYRVVSPEPGTVSALPEVLTRAQAGEFSDQVPATVQTQVTDILTGRRAAEDPDREAYALLLAAVFRSWHDPMPEVFPAAVDWIGLLTPVDILAPTSVRAAAVEVMDEQACANVEVVGWLYQFYNAEVKAKIDEAKDKIDAAELAPVTQLFTPHWIVRYLVENSLGRLWLRSRPTSGLRAQMDYYVEPVEGQEDTGVTVDGPEEIRLVDPACGSGHMLTYAFDLLFAIYEEEGHAPSAIPVQILTNNLRGLELDPRAAQLAAFALAMKAREKDRRFFTRRDDAGRPVQPDIVVISPVRFEKHEMQTITGAVAEPKRDGLAQLVHSFADADTFGSLIRVDPDALASLEAALAEVAESGEAADELPIGLPVLPARTLLKQARALADDQYHVVVANPPYLGSGNMGAKLSEFAKKQFPDTKADLYAIFIERNAELSVPAGSVAMVTMHSWMFLSSYKNFRAGLSDWGHLASMAHLGAHGFDSISGEVVQTTAFVIDVLPNLGKTGVFLRLVDGANEEEKRSALLGILKAGALGPLFLEKGADFKRLPDSVMAYWVSGRVEEVFGGADLLGELSAVRCGMNTGNNALFVREWWEPSLGGFVTSAESEEEFWSEGGVWCPYNKGGRSRRWWGNQTSVLRFDKKSAEILSRQGNKLPSRNLYFRPSVSWSKIGGATFRVYPQGFVFDGAGMSVFESGALGLSVIAGYLNSTASVKFLEALAPTVNVQSGDVSNLPVGFGDIPSPPEVGKLVDIFRDDWNEFETSWDFRRSPLMAEGPGRLGERARSRWEGAIDAARNAQGLEEANNRYFAELYGLEDEVECEVPLSSLVLSR